MSFLFNRVKTYRNSSTDAAGAREEQGAAKVQQLEAAETKQPEAQPAQ